MSKGVLVSLVDKTPQALSNAECIEKLEEWVQMARAGQVTAFAITGVGPDRRSITGFAGSMMWDHLLAGLSKLQYRVNAYVDSQSNILDEDDDEAPQD